MVIYPIYFFPRLPLLPAADTQRPKLAKLSSNIELKGAQRGTDSRGEKLAERTQSKKFRATQRKIRALDKKIRYFLYIYFFALFRYLSLTFFFYFYSLFPSIALVLFIYILCVFRSFSCLSLSFHLSLSLSPRTRLKPLPCF